MPSHSQSYDLIVRYLKFKHALKRETNSENDKLISRSGFLGLKKATINVNKGILSNVKSGVVEKESGPVTYDYISMMGEETGQALFEFMSKNTDVEWSLMKFGEGGLQSNILSTSHEKDSEAGTTDILLNDPLGRASDLRGVDYNHPNGDWRASGSIHAQGGPHRSGNVAVAGLLQRIHKGKNLNFRVYTAAGGYAPFIGETYNPIVFPEIIINGKK